MKLGAFFYLVFLNIRPPELPREYNSEQSEETKKHKQIRLRGWGEGRGEGRGERAGRGDGQV